MKESFVLTPEAEDDIFEIWQYIASDSPRGADRVEEAIYAACAFLAKSPHAGRARPEVTRLPARFWPVQQFPNYVIIYRSGVHPLQIIRILHGQRNLSVLLIP